MSDCKWRLIDELNKPFYLDSNDKCVYAREHFSGGYELSESNQMLFNFKKPVSKKANYEWKFKIHSIVRFAAELNILNFPENAIIIPAPTSKRHDSPDYDDRINQAIEHLIEYRPDLIVQNIIDLSQDLPSAHSENGIRNPNELENFIIVSDFINIPTPKQVFLIDDMITTGGHFKAIKKCFNRKYPDTEIIGVFWAKHIFDTE